MKTLFSFFTVLALFGSSSFYLADDIKLGTSKIDTNTTKKIQLALLLDSSNSMDGLIDQAKAKLWNVVNEMTDMEPDANLEIALYHYGNDGLRQMDHYVERLSAFTTDVDRISELLFSIRTNGGQEYCGAVMQSALKELRWDDDAMYKVLFIAGNEPFNQGPIPYRTVFTDLQKAGVYINTIFCGPHAGGTASQWNTNESLGLGKYFSLNKDEAVQFINTPYDEKIQSLNLKLNKTFIPYGRHGQQKYENLKIQDQNATAYGVSNIAARANYKIKKQYNNAEWDLLDAYEADNKIINDETKLPKNYIEMSESERKKKIEDELKNRAKIKKEIANLSKRRSAFIKAQPSSTNQLDDQIIQAVKEQLYSQKTMGQLIIPSRVDYDGFADMVQEVAAYRAQRMVSAAEFNTMAKDKNTIILDTRSKAMYNQSHVAGAVHLNFSDFGEKKLAKLIPSKNTRILIYCNNNIRGNERAYVRKAAPLALNIPTFVNLYGYGYRNIYELSEDVEYSGNKLTFASN